MFAEIAPTYDLCNSLMSFSMHRRWRDCAVKLLNLSQGDKAIDVCSGTGDFLRPLRRAVGPNGIVLGADFCLPMLRLARSKTPASLLLSDAVKLPIRNESFDGATVGWGIRNVPDADAAHREIARVLKSGGRFASIDMAQPRNRFLGAFSSWAFHRAVPLLGALFRKRTAYTYLPKSTAVFKSREELVESMRGAGFVDVGYRDMFFGNICIHWGTKA